MQCTGRDPSQLLRRHLDLRPLSSPLPFIAEYSGAHVLEPAEEGRRTRSLGGERCVGCIHFKKITSCGLATVHIGTRLRSNVPGAPSTQRMQSVQSSVEADLCADSRRHALCCATHQRAWGWRTRSPFPVLATPGVAAFKTVSRRRRSTRRPKHVFYSSTAYTVHSPV